MKERILTGIIGGAGFLALLWIGGIWYSGLTLLLALGTYFEYVRMRKSKLQIPMLTIGFIFIVSLFFLELTSFSLLMIVWIFVFVLLSFSVFSKNKVTIEDISYVFIGIFYITFGFYFMNEVRIESGFEWAILTVALVWGTDTGAYFSGRFFGRRKLWPEISPKKTIEGSIGGTLTAVIIAVLFYYFGNAISELIDALILGIVVAIVAQIGDLFESAIKRTFHVKDSGKILPGHGGFFDRFDSMIAVFPVVYFLITFFG